MENSAEIARGLPDDVLSAEFARRFGTGRPPKLRPCPKCGDQMGARKLREHLPRCAKANP